MTTTSTARSIATRTSVGVALVLSALVVANVLALAGALALGAGGLGQGHRVLLSTVTTEVGFLVVALTFLALFLDRSFVPVGRPTRGELHVGGLALGGALALEIGRQLAVRFEVLSAASSLPTGQLDTTLLLAVVAVAVLVAPPVEELLFRGVIQRYVASAASARAGIAVATVLFVPMHALGIIATATGLDGALALVGVLVAVSVLLGVAYERTDNLVVPVAVHACYNALSAAVGIALVG